MRLTALLLASLTLYHAGCQTPSASPPDSAATVQKPTYIGSIERIDGRIGTYLAGNARIEQLATGFSWAEGPLWIPDRQMLLFSDVPENVVYAWSDTAGVRVFLKPSGLARPDPELIREAGANGLALDGNGRLLLADSGNRALARFDFETGRKRLIARRYDGKRLNSPNDVISTSDSTVYFTDPPYGLAGGLDSPLRELPFSGVYRYRERQPLELITSELRFPNGVALSPDEATLYVSNSDPERPIIMAYDLTAETPAGRLFFDATALREAGGPGLPDGMAVHADGTLFATGPGGVLVLSPAGEHLGTISTGGPVANVAFGPDQRMLFMTSDSVLARVRLR
ncbi:MAG: SMP-30/gluconolactonase/LRE family protein [Bacteroidota bacterium]